MELKEAAIAVIKTQASDAVTEAEAMTSEQWARYSTSLRLYYSSEFPTSFNWAESINAAMQGAGCSNLLSLVLALIRNEQELRDAFKPEVK